MKKQYFSLVLILLVFVGICVHTSCKKSNNPALDAYNNFNRTAMLQNIAESTVVPCMQMLDRRADSLTMAINTLSDQVNETNLIQTQNAWRKAQQALKQAETLQFGPIKSMNVYPDMDFWPIRPTSIENFYTNSSTIDQTILLSQGSLVKGMPVIEYLIFNPEKGNSYILSQLADSKRINYVKQLGIYFKNNTASILSNWKSYSPTYSTNAGQDINGSINITINQMIMNIDFIKGTKVGIPAGKKDGTIYPDKVESLESRQSNQDIIDNLQALKSLFNGAGSSTNQIGFDDFLNYLQSNGIDNAHLADRINKQIDDCITKTIALPAPLQTAVTQQPEQVNALYNSLKQLLVLVKVEMVNDLGVTLTFNDNDGD